VQKIIRRLKERGLGILITDHNVRKRSSYRPRHIIHKGEVLVEGSAEFGQRSKRGDYRTEFNM
jgi:lipopolysaccharide export system ATP-binding protein